LPPRTARNSPTPPTSRCLTAPRFSSVPTNNRSKSGLQNYRGGSFYEGPACQVPSGSLRFGHRPPEPSSHKQEDGGGGRRCDARYTDSSWPVVESREVRLVDPPSIRVAMIASTLSFVRVRRRTTAGARRSRCRTGGPRGDTRTRHERRAPAPPRSDERIEQSVTP
jgi:hypothetical protein